MKKKISVVIPVYNAEKYIKQAINSILKQTYQNFEIICIDDCSTDDTFNIVSSIKDTRIFLYRNKINRGVIYTRSKAYSLCSGEFIANMDADDIAYFNRLEKEIIYLEKNHDIDIVGSWISKIDKDSKHLGYWKTVETDDQIKALMMFKMPVANPTVMFRSSIKADLFHEKEFYLVEDYALYVHLASKGYKFHNIQEPLLYYRVLENSLSHANEYNINLTNNSHELVYKKIFTNLNISHLYTNLHRKLIYEDIKTEEELNAIAKHLEEIINCPIEYCSRKVLRIEVSHMWTSACLRASKNIKINLIDILFHRLTTFDSKSIKYIIKAVLK